MHVGAMRSWGKRSGDEWLFFCECQDQNYKLVLCNDNMFVHNINLRSCCKHSPVHKGSLSFRQLPDPTHLQSHVRKVHVYRVSIRKSYCGTCSFVLLSKRPTPTAQMLTVFVILSPVSHLPIYSSSLLEEVAIVGEAIVTELVPVLLAVDLVLLTFDFGLFFFAALGLGMR